MNGKEWYLHLLTHGLPAQVPGAKDLMDEIKKRHTYIALSNENATTLKNNLGKPIAAPKKTIARVAGHVRESLRMLAFLAGWLVVVGWWFLLKEASKPYKYMNLGEILMVSVVSVFNAVLASFLSANPLGREARWLRSMRKHVSTTNKLALLNKAPVRAQGRVRLLAMEALKAGGDTTKLASLLKLTPSQVIAIGEKVLRTWTITPQKKNRNKRRFGIVAIQGVSSKLMQKMAHMLPRACAKKVAVGLLLASHAVVAHAPGPHPGLAHAFNPANNPRWPLSLPRNLENLRNLRAMTLTNSNIRRLGFNPRGNVRAKNKNLFKRTQEYPSIPSLPTNASARISNINANHNENVIQKAQRGYVMQRTVTDQSVLNEYSVIASGLSFCRSALIYNSIEDTASRRHWFNSRWSPERNFAYLIDATKAIESGSVHHIADTNSHSINCPLLPKCGVGQKYNLPGDQKMQYAQAVTYARKAISKLPNHELGFVDTEINLDLNNDLIVGIVVKIKPFKEQEDIKSLWLQLGGIVHAAQNIADELLVQNKLRHVYGVNPWTKLIERITTYKQFERLHARPNFRIRRKYDPVDSHKQNNRINY